MLINTLAYVRYFDILCISKFCQKGEYAYVCVNYHIKQQNNQPIVLPTYEKKQFLEQS
jgi:nitrate reductase cytochrome c-type subunit